MDRDVADLTALASFVGAAGGLNKAGASTDNGQPNVVCDASKSGRAMAASAGRY